MLQGLYNLTSGVLTQNRNLNVISNNMVNVSTPGFKSDTMVSTSFKDEMLYRSSNQGTGANVPIGNTSRIRTAQETLTDYQQGSLEETGGTLDLAIAGDGFFVIQGQGGNVYTRNGSFTLDEQGYLTLPGIGRVMGKNGPLLLNDDKINIDTEGVIRNEDGVNLGTLRLVDFANYDNLQKNKAGYFTGANPYDLPGSFVHKAVEKSNISVVSEMTKMMTSQRAIHSAAQVIKIYDQMMQKVTNEIGRL